MPARRFSVSPQGGGLAILNAPLPTPSVGIPYSTTLTGLGGKPPYSWALSSTGSNAWSINAATGQITGTPTAGETDTLTATLADSSTPVQHAKQAFSVAVSNPAATPTFSKASGTYTTPIPFTISCATPGSSIYYTLTFAAGSGTTPVIGQPGTTLYTGSINDSAIGPLVVNAIAVAPGFTQSAVGTVAYTATAATYLGAPRTGRMLVGGNSAFPGSNSGVAALALINVSVCQNFNSLEQTMVTNYGRNFPQMISAIAAGTSAVGNPYCVQVPYSIMEACSNTTGLNSTLTVQYSNVNAQNWFLRTTYPGGTIVGQGASNTQEANSGNQSVTHSTSLGTLNYPQWWFTYAYNLQIAGQGGAMGESTYPVACSGWAGQFSDNFFNATRQTGDWGNNGVSLSAGNATANAYLQKGQAQGIAKRRTLRTDLLLANCDWFANISAVYDPAMLNILDGQLCEYVLGNAGQCIENFMSFSQVVSQLQLSASKLLNSKNITLLGQVSPDRSVGDFPTLQSSWGTREWRGARYGAAMSAALDCYHALADGQSGSAQYNAQNLSLWRMDEYGGFGGGLPNASTNWSGAPIDSIAAGLTPIQGSLASGNAVLRRRFANCTWYWTPSSNTAPVTINVNGHHLATSGFGDAAVNNGAAFISITLQVRDGVCVLP